MEKVPRDWKIGHVTIFRWPFKIVSSAQLLSTYIYRYQRSLFDFCLEDQFLQRELCNLKDEPLMLKKLFDEACVAEQKRKSFQEKGVSSSHLIHQQELVWVSGSQKVTSLLGVAVENLARMVVVALGVASSSLPPPVQWEDQASGRQGQQAEVSEGSSSARHNKPGACFKCQQFGHWTKLCMQPTSQQKTKIVEDGEGWPEQTFNSLKIVASDSGSSSSVEGAKRQQLRQ